MLVENARGFFGAGSETVRTTIDWSLILMADCVDIQSRVHAELDQVIGHERQVAWADRLSLPYTSAVLMEVQRWASVVPMNVPRRAVDDVVVQGVRIPKDTNVFINLWSVHHDAQIYAQPEAFDPERFYDRSANVLVKQEAFIPFSAGE